jgi:hypothetical protein
VSEVVVQGGNATVVVQNRRPTTTVQGRGNTTQLAQTSTPVSVRDGAPVVVATPIAPTVEVGTRIGPRGHRGETEGATFNAVAGETIHGGRVVRISGGLLYHPDTSNADHADQVVGIAVQSGSAGATLSVRTKGVFAPGPTFGDGRIFCSNGGVLTQTPPTTGWLMVVARPVSTTSIDVDPEPAFHLAS